MFKLVLLLLVLVFMMTIINGFKNIEIIDVPIAENFTHHKNASIGFWNRRKFIFY